MVFLEPQGNNYSELYSEKVSDMSLISFFVVFSHLY